MNLIIKWRSNDKIYSYLKLSELFISAGLAETTENRWHGGLQSLKITDYVMSHIGISIFKVWKESKMVATSFLEKVSDFVWAADSNGK